MNQKKVPIAVVVSDIHLRENTPRARAAEPSWEAVQIRHLAEVERVATKRGVPVIIAGDLFHRWDTTANTINLALANLPQAYAVPGQHDLPHHRMEDISQSAYWTCVLAEKITHLTEPEAIEVNGVTCVLYPFGWGQPLLPLKRKKSDDRIHIAVVHASIYLSKEHKGVSDDQMLDRWEPLCRGYDFAVFGDNHQGFVEQAKGCLVVNCGGMIPTNIDQISQKTGFCLLYSDGTAERMWFDLSEDLWSLQQTTAKATDSEDAAVKSIIHALTAFQSMDLKFPDAVREVLIGLGGAVSPDARQYIGVVLEETRA